MSKDQLVCKELAIRVDAAAPCSSAGAVFRAEKLQKLGFGVALSSPGLQQAMLTLHNNQGRKAFKGRCHPWPRRHPAQGRLPSMQLRPIHRRPKPLHLALGLHLFFKDGFVPSLAVGLQKEDFLLVDAPTLVNIHELKKVVELLGRTTKARRQTGRRPAFTVQTPNLLRIDRVPQVCRRSEFVLDPLADSVDKLPIFGAELLQRQAVGVGAQDVSSRQLQKPEPPQMPIKLLQFDIHGTIGIQLPSPPAEQETTSFLRERCDKSMPLFGPFQLLALLLEDRRLSPRGRK
mmetsp:Transcript_36204/g.83471  ORF Transcript_36204/g.83471 Transcript_36204/m.83471 type:complete len:289 (+) Transcript_36204:1303-2169(+)